MDLRHPLEEAMGISFVPGNRVRVLRNGLQIFPPMLEAIRQAHRYVEFVSYVYWTGQIAEKFAHALADKAREGVAVRVLLDSYGAKPMPQELIEVMDSAGVEIRWFRPLGRLKLWKNDHRTHRKLLICDGRVGFTGGVGIAKEWQGDARYPQEWRDTHFQVEGPVVRHLRAAFLGNWSEAGGRIRDLNCSPDGVNSSVGSSDIQVVRSNTSVGWSDITTIMHTLIEMAGESLNISTAYFVPDEQSMELLIQAARRGVKVRFLVPGPHINHTLCQLAGQHEYKPLLEAGIAIRQYQPTMLHTKIITVDGMLSCIGSANFNQRSLRKDDEVCMLVHDRETPAILNEHFEEDYAQGKPIENEGWSNRGLIQRFYEKVTMPLRQEL